MTTTPAADRHGTQAWFEIHVDDIDRAADFYRDVFGWSFQALDGFPFGRYLMITTRAGAGGNGAIAQNSGHGTPEAESTVIYLEVEDIPDAVEAAVKAGGSVHRPYMDIGGQHGFCAIVRDPDGNHLGLWADH